MITPAWIGCIWRNLFGCIWVKFLRTSWCPLHVTILISFQRIKHNLCTEAVFKHKYMPPLLLPYVLSLVMPFIFQVRPQCAQGQSDRVQFPITWYLCSFGIGEFHHQLALVSHWSQGDIQVPLDYWALIWRSDFWKNQNILRLWALPSQDMILLTFTKF